VGITVPLARPLDNPTDSKETIMKYILLLFLGIPIPIILLVALFT